MSDFESIRDAITEKEDIVNLTPEQLETLSGESGGKKRDNARSADT